MEVTAKGIDQRITLSEVLGIGGRHKLSVPQTEEPLVPLAEEVPFMYALVDGAQLSGETGKGSLTMLAERRAEAHLENAVPTMSNLKMRLVGSDGQEIPGALSCKVGAGYRRTVIGTLYYAGQRDAAGFNFTCL